MASLLSLVFFFFNDPTTTEIYTLSLHDALPIFSGFMELPFGKGKRMLSSGGIGSALAGGWQLSRSEEHTSELQSLRHLVCRLLLEKKKKHYKHKTARYNLTLQHATSNAPRSCAR